MNKISNQESVNLLDLFKSKLDNAFSFDFQNIFHCLMKATYEESYDTPKATGSLGDRGNDGYIGTSNWYFAVYGPQTKSPKAKNTENKFKSDFEKILNNSTNWPYKLKKFTFVINTNSKIEGISPNLLKERDNYQLKNPEITIEFWNQHDLIKLFTNLNQNKQKQVLRQSYSFAILKEDFSLDASIIEKITLELMEQSQKNDEKVSYNLLKFEEKIKLNNLDEIRKDDLCHAAYYVNSLDSILDELDTYSAENLSKSIKNIYDKAAKLYEEENLQFDYIILKMMAAKNSQFNYEEIVNHKKIWKDSVLIIMAKYFENCSIFKSEE